VSPVKYELGLCIPEDGILHSHRRENLKSYVVRYYLQLSKNTKDSLQSYNHRGYADMQHTQK
jgi:hypothetical protein